MEQTGSQRVACYDVLRVAATFAVVALHLSAQHWADTDIYSTAWQAFNLYDSLVRWTVPVFVMISGVFFLAGTQSLRQILRKNVLRIVTAFIFWSVLYAAYAYFFNKCALSTAVTLFFSGHYHMWFLFMIVGLYLIVPLLRPIAQNETLLRYFLLLALVFNFLLPQLGALLSLFSWPLYSSYLSLSGMLYYHFTLGFAAYFMLGRYLSRKELSPKAARWCYALGVAGLIVTVVMTSYASHRLGTATVLFYNYDSVGVLLMCLAVFVFARRHLNFPSLGEKGHARIRALSRWSFGAYLVHPLFIETFDQFLGVNTLSCNAFFSVPLLTLLIGTSLVSAAEPDPIVNKCPLRLGAKRSAGQQSALCIRSPPLCCDKEVRRRGKQVFGLQHLKASRGDGRLQRVHTVKRHIGHFPRVAAPPLAKKAHYGACRAARPGSPSPRGTFPPAAAAHGCARAPPRGFRGRAAHCRRPPRQSCRAAGSRQRDPCTRR